MHLNILKFDDSALPFSFVYCTIFICHIFHVFKILLIKFVNKPFMSGWIPAFTIPRDTPVHLLIKIPYARIWLPISLGPWGILTKLDALLIRVLGMCLFQCPAHGHSPGTSRPPWGILRVWNERDIAFHKGLFNERVFCAFSRDMMNARRYTLVIQATGCPKQYSCLENYQNYIIRPILK